MLVHSCASVYDAGAAVNLPPPAVLPPGYNANPALCQVKCLDGFPPMLITAVQCHPRYLPFANGFEVPMSLLSYVFPRSHCQHNLSAIVTVQ